MKRALVCGAGGFIGGHLAERLKNEGYFVRGVDIKNHEYGLNPSDEFIRGDLRDMAFCKSILEGGFDEIYQLAADMGGAGYVFTGMHDADVMHNSAQINLNLLEAVKKDQGVKIFFSSSACIYPEYNQQDPENPNCAEDSAYPAQPDSEYGWEKLFSERLYLAYARNYGLKVRVARFHNIYGPMGTFKGGREKAPAALCRKIAEVSDGGAIEIWGDGLQTRSFLYISDCLDALRRMMQADFEGPLNIGSEEMITINRLAEIIAEAAGKRIYLKHLDGPLGVRGRRSDNKLIAAQLGWKPEVRLQEGLRLTYDWILKQVSAQSH